MNDCQKPNENYLEWLERIAIKCKGKEVVLDAGETLEGIAEIKYLFLKAKRDQEYTHRENQKLKEAINWWNNGKASQTLHGLCNEARKAYGKKLGKEAAKAFGKEGFKEALEKYEEWCKKYHPDMLED